MQRQIRLVAHNIRSLWNVGSFFRTADALQVEHIYLTGYTGLPPRKEISKTAIGAEAFVPWEHVRDPLPLLHDLRADGWHILSLECTDDAQNLSTFVPPQKTCLIVGHELFGVPQEQLRLSDTVVSIPMFGRKESLNVAVAAGIALYHLRCSALQ